MSESNRKLIFSDVIASQISTSLASNTFNILRDSQYRFEIIRLCALWDSARSDRESISTIAALVDSLEAQELVANEARSQRTSMGDGTIFGSHNEAFREYIIQSAREDAKVEGDKWAIRASLQIRRACQHVQKIQLSRRLNALRDLRDHRIAHTLADTARRRSPGFRLRYRDSFSILRLSCRIIELFNLSLCGVCYKLEDVRKLHEENARLFWDGITVNVLG
ncbi:MAG TPA: hypothetical protein PK812_07815 [Beijerinckiaceae bacterium]|nr:hypothetical protein [Beijerinckiaceae bacterium]